MAEVEFVCLKATADNRDERSHSGSYGYIFGKFLFRE